MHTETAPARALKYLETQDADVIVTDMNMPQMNGADVCRQIIANREDVPIVVMTAFGSMETAVAAIRAGAHDFVTKPFEIEDLVLRLERAIRERSLREEVKRLRATAQQASQFEEIIGQSAPMGQVLDLITRVAESDTSVLVTGESGTGKELVARALHQRSLRQDGPFVAINCAAMPAPLLESE